MVSRYYLRWKLKLFFELRTDDLHRIFNSSAQTRIWPLHAYTHLLSHTGLATQFQEYNFPVNHPSLFFTAHFHFNCFWGAWLFYILSIISPKCLTSFKPQDYTVQLTAQRAVSWHSAMGPVYIMDGCSPPPSILARCKSILKRGFMIHCSKLHQSFVSLGWNLDCSGWED